MFSLLAILKRNDMLRSFLFVVMIVIGACSAKEDKNERLLGKVKWFFYAYASSLDGKLRSGERMSPLSCDIATYEHRISEDSIVVYCRLFYKDTNNICFLRPMQLGGIKVIRKRLFLPIYHAVEFETRSDSVEMSEMYIQQKALVQKIKAEKNVCDWLLTNKDEYISEF